MAEDPTISLGFLIIRIGLKAKEIVSPSKKALSDGETVTYSR